MRKILNAIVVACALLATVACNHSSSPSGPSSTATFNYQVTGLKVVFTNTSPSPVVSWNYGDNTQGTDTTHIYTAAGDYMVTLTTSTGTSQPVKVSVAPVTATVANFFDSTPTPSGAEDTHCIGAVSVAGTLDASISVNPGGSVQLYIRTTGISGTPIGTVSVSGTNVSGSWAVAPAPANQYCVTMRNTSSVGQTFNGAVKLTTPY